MSDLWTAMKLSSNGSRSDPTRTDLKSYKAAHKYSKLFHCKSCRNSLATRLRHDKNGTFVSEKDYWKIWANKNNIDPSDESDQVVQDFLEDHFTMFGSYGEGCDAEWSIMPTDEFKTLFDTEEDFERFVTKEEWKDCL